MYILDNASIFYVMGVFLLLSKTLYYKCVIQLFDDEYFTDLKIDNISKNIFIKVQ